ncbi:MAG: hypothetical protein LBR30_06295, partial [Clostridioides sp.]|nr:hypothetical protein [Clostridioides sp.]
MSNIDNNEVRRVLVEKKEGFNIEANALKNEIVDSLHISSVENVRILNRYDVEGISREIFQTSIATIFSEPNLDSV